MNYEFGPGKMMVHISGNQAENPPKLFTIKDVDQARRTLTLNFEDGSETTATFQGGQLTLRGPIHIVVLNRISKEVFASRFTPPPAVAGDVTQGDIPANRASGSVHGVPFTVEKAKLQNDILFLRQGATSLQTSLLQSLPLADLSRSWKEGVSSSSPTERVRDPCRISICGIRSKAVICPKPTPF